MKLTINVETFQDRQPVSHKFELSMETCGELQSQLHKLNRFLQATGVLFYNESLKTITGYGKSDEIFDGLETK